MGTGKIESEWVKAYYNDPAVVETAAYLLIFSALFQIFDGSQVVLLGSLRGLADVNKAFQLALVTYLIMGVPLMYLLGFVFDLGGAGVWSALALSLAVAAVFFFFRFKRKCRMVEERE